MTNKYVSDVVWSLDNEPQKWSYDAGGFRLCHENGKVEVWITNRSYGLHITLQNRRVWGGVTWLSTVGLSVSHWRLWRAVKRWERRGWEPLLRPKPGQSE